MRAIETRGILDHQGHLHLDRPQPPGQLSRVRIILLLPDIEDYDLSEMANDPDIQAELSNIQQEFTIAEIDRKSTRLNSSHVD